MKILILAGGGGTRLFPLSRPDEPKQFLSIGSSSSLLELTVRRFLPLARQEDIAVITNERHYHRSVAELQKIGLRRVRVLQEPCGRNTLPAVCYGLLYFRENKLISEHETVLVTPADHLVSPAEEFVKQVKKAARFALRDSILTFGVKPAWPETGYGYIQCGGKAGPGLAVKRFIEKPDLALARRLIQNPRCYWNSGIFAFTLAGFLKALSVHQPTLHAFFEKHGFKEAARLFPSLKPVSIDYGIMEKASGVLCAPLSVSWSDVGTWDSVYAVGKKDGRGNVSVGDCALIDAEGSLFYSTGRLVAAAGVKDVIVIETPDAVLVTARGRSQLVKDVSAKLAGRSGTGAARNAGFTAKTIHADADSVIRKINVLPGRAFRGRVKKGRQVLLVFSRSPGRLFVGGRARAFSARRPVSLAAGAGYRLENNASKPIAFLEIEHPAGEK